jgi:hypothetical protein
MVCLYVVALLQVRTNRRTQMSNHAAAAISPKQSPTAREIRRLMTKVRIPAKVAQKRAMVLLIKNVIIF